MDGHLKWPHRILLQQGKCRNRLKADCRTTWLSTEVRHGALESNGDGRIQINPRFLMLSASR